MFSRWVVLAAILGGLPAPPVKAQTASREPSAWTLELLVAREAARPSSGAQTQLPAPGPTFTYGSIQSRRVPSWYSGDGAALLDADVSANFRIFPIDSLLSGAYLVRPNAAAIGVRVGRRLTSRLTAEFAVTSGHAAPKVVERDQLALGRRKGRVSFESLWDRQKFSRTRHGIRIDVRAGGQSGHDDHHPQRVGEGSEHTLEEVGQSFAVTRERIRQIEAKALRKLWQPSRSRRLKP